MFSTVFTFVCVFTTVLTGKFINMITKQSACVSAMSGYVSGVGEGVSPCLSWYDVYLPAIGN